VHRGALTYPLGSRALASSLRASRRAPAHTPHITYHISHVYITKIYIYTYDIYAHTPKPHIYIAHVHHTRYRVRPRSDRRSSVHVYICTYISVRIYLYVYICMYISSAEGRLPTHLSRGLTGCGTAAAHAPAVLPVACGAYAIRMTKSVEIFGIIRLQIQTQQQLQRPMAWATPCTPM
jgi:hypothetical protein